MTVCVSQGLRVRFDLPYGPEEDEERAKRKRPPTPRPKDKPGGGDDDAGDDRTGPDGGDFGHDADDGVGVGVGEQASVEDLVAPGAVVRRTEVFERDSSAYINCA
jgi:hypothetical protein